jgi:hypothetical protein
MHESLTFPTDKFNTAILNFWGVKKLEPLNISHGSTVKPALFIDLLPVAWTKHDQKNSHCTFSVDLEKPSTRTMLEYWTLHAEPSQFFLNSGKTTSGK